VTHVLNHGVTKSLTVWLQRYGRTGRQLDKPATATMIVERSVFDGAKTVESRAKETGDEGIGAGRGVDDQEETATSTASRGVGESGKSAKGRVATGKKCKQVEYWTLKYIREMQCRRNPINEAFKNPIQAERECDGYSL
jgi:superfamily II DNA/RNA helicase